MTVYPYQQCDSKSIHSGHDWKDSQLFTWRCPGRVATG